MKIETDIEEFKQWLYENLKYKLNEQDDYDEFAKFLIKVCEENNIREYFIIPECSASGELEVYVF